MAGDHTTPTTQQLSPNTTTATNVHQMNQVSYRPNMGGGAPFPPSSQTDQVLLGYLQRRGYRQTAQVLAQEAKIRSPEDMVVESLVRREASSRGSGVSVYGVPMGSMSLREYEDQYSCLKRWAESSLDMFKYELRSILYPIFVHCYLELIAKSQTNEAKKFFDKFKPDHVELHAQEIQKLSSVMIPMHLKENELAMRFRQNKFNLKMSEYSFKLMMSFLQDNDFVLLLRIINEHINILAFVGKSKGVSMDEKENSIGLVTGSSLQTITGINSKSILWGLLPEDHEFLDALESKLQEMEKNGELKFQDKDKKLIAQRKSMLEPEEKMPSRDRIPLPKFKEQDVTMEISTIQELREQIRLGRSELPSIACYTFHNSHDAITNIEFSHNSNLVSVGSDDSIIKVWSLKGENLYGLRSDLELPTTTPDSLPSSDLSRFKEKEGSIYKKLIGHCGAVYGQSFAPDNKFLISSSADTTIRLWSLDTFSNLVCYKGHNYPVWDVEFSPLGHYFVSGSNDKTARLWSTEYIHPLRIFAGHLSDVDVVKFHPNCNYIATGSSDRTVRLWDVQSGQCVRLFMGHTGAVFSMAFSPEGRMLATAGEDKSVIIWDLASGLKLKSLEGHQDCVTSLSFSSNSSILASSSLDCTVRIWDSKRSSSNVVSSTTDSTGSNLETSSDLLGTFPTKCTPLQQIQFSRSNVLLAAGPFLP